MDEKKKAEEAAAAKAAADAAAVATAEAEARAKAEEEANAPARALAERDEEIAKLKEERDNYKNVALKRLGKLPGDAGFIEGADEKTGLTVEEQVQKVLIEKEIAKAEQAKDGLIKNQAKTIAELTLALKNRPQSSLGGGGSETLESKDNVLSEQQIIALKERARKIGAKDVDAFVEKAKQNLLRR